MLAAEIRRPVSWHRVLTAVHRDAGFFFAGVLVVYAISGIAVNHVDHWDPDFIIQRRAVSLALPIERTAIDREAVLASLAPLGIHQLYQGHDFPAERKLKVYLEGGSILAELPSGAGEYESIERRPVLYGLNRLHLDPKGWWRVFSDAFAAGLIVLAFTGALLRRGRTGFIGRGKWFLGAGLVFPLLMLNLLP